MKMQLDELPQITPDVDYSEILPIQQKRTIAFVNHFIMNTVSYLNTFAQSCESRFMAFEYKMQKIEASLLILEAQLSSIPGFDKPNNSLEVTSKENSTEEKKENLNISSQVTSSLPQQLPGFVDENQASTQESVDNGSQEPQTKASSGTKASDDPRFVKFFKMLRVGVQEPAVKLKMQSEGFDPSILDNPDAIIPELDNTQQITQ